jgi:hypothetical protein
MVLVKVAEPDEAVRTTSVSAATEAISPSKYTLLAPSGMRTDGGRVTAVDVLESWTRIPPAGAYPSSVTFARIAEPPSTVAVGLREINVGCRTVKVASAPSAPTVARMTPLVVETVGVVVTENVFANCPSGTVTEAGTETTPEEDDTEITVPPAGAGLPGRDTWHETEYPPASSVGVQASPRPDSVRRRSADRCWGLLISWSDSVVNRARIVPVVGCVTGVVAIGKVAVDAPGAIVTVGGTVMLGSVLSSVTIVCPVGYAGPMSPTVPVAWLPPTIAVGDTVTEVTSGRTAAIDASSHPPAQDALSVPLLGWLGSLNTRPVTVRGKSAVHCPGGTVTEPGTEKRSGAEEVRETTAPSAGARPVRRVTEHITVVVGLRGPEHLISRVWGTTSMEALFLWPP